MSCESQSYPICPIGTKGEKWGDAERQQWRALQTKKRDYNTDVVEHVKATFDKNAALAAVAEIVPYGTLDYTHLGLPKYDLIAVKSKEFRKDLRTVLVTGGVHGYETSGVHGAMLFIAERFAEFASKLNVLVLPCVSPWGYETVNRWNPDAVDPNRSFKHAAPGCNEAALAMSFVTDVSRDAGDLLIHLDLHETTDTDNSEFIPAKFARDGIEPEEWSEIPDGFYLIGDSSRADQDEIHVAMIEAVRHVTHIAPADEHGCIAGLPKMFDGVVASNGERLSVCKSFTNATYVTTTEVYPDSPKTSAEECNRAQITCVVAGINYAFAAKVLAN
ncbi:peptidase, putative [Bodo saltans]|uniref:Peptidase, putative n=1 Tax=Bodo saltans TaxID=75058 RepID=A0A0S4IT46_BODSA|nr:peptidase, putative [Bodo saltans]|eukprot:CUF69803.1 peptidase, putative [Bodo saltans]